MHLLNLEKDQHIRYNPLKDEWVLVSPQRVNRPWQGKVEKDESNNDSDKSEIAKNTLAPGAIRAFNRVNDEYTTTFVFENDFPALLPQMLKEGGARKTMSETSGGSDLFKWAPANGECRVMCFSPNPDSTIALMPIFDIENIIKEWMDQIKDLGSIYSWVQIFENKGEIMGRSNPHPHCQIWASSFIPNEARIKDQNQLTYYLSHNKEKPMLLEYCHKELVNKVRIIDENDSWVTLVPFWAVWPYEVMILPRRHVLRFTDLKGAEIRDLAEIMRKLMVRYDNLFECPFPYSMGWHGAPTGTHYDEDMNHWLFHGIYYPPLLRSANVRKFMVGYELFAQPQRDITPEKAAESLRTLSSSTHYTNK